MLGKTLGFLCCAVLAFAPDLAIAQDDDTGGMRPYDQARPYQDSAPYEDTQPYDEGQPYDEEQPQQDMQPYDEEQPREQPHPYHAQPSRETPPRDDIYRHGGQTVAVDLFRADDSAPGDRVADSLRTLLIQALRRDGRLQPVRSTSPEHSGTDLVIEGVVTRYRFSPAARGGQSADVTISFELVDAATGEPLGHVSASGSGIGAEAGDARAMNAEDLGVTALGRAAMEAYRFAVPKIVGLASRAPQQQEDERGR